MNFVLIRKPLHVCPWPSQIQHWTECTRQRGGAKRIAEENLTIMALGN